MESKENEGLSYEEARKLWIKGAIGKKGALRAQLGIKKGEKIPKSVLQSIVNAKTGATISFRGKKIRVTTKLKRRAILALRLGKMKKRTESVSWRNAYDAIVTRPEVERFIESVKLYEGLEFVTFEEAKLTYARRQKLPASAFCGPDRSYPAHDAKHVRNAFARLATFGGKLPKATRAKIYRCLRSRAKKYGIEHDAKNYKWKASGDPNPVRKKRVQETVEWFEKRHADIFTKCKEC